MGKHAYLVMAHSNAESLINCIKSIDDERNDIFIHLDKKWKDVDCSLIENAAKKSHIYFTNRISVSWGGDTQIKCELLLLRLAIDTGDYDYYHLLSGQDMCIKTQDYIHKFFAEHYGVEFVAIGDDEWTESVSGRVKYYYFLQGRRDSYILNYTNKILKVLQKLVGVNRLRNNKLKLMSGSQWFSITGELAKYLLEKEDDIWKMFGKGRCVDEMFLQTMVTNEPKFFNAVYGFANNEYPKEMANLRLIDWKRGNPYVFKEEDFEEIVKSPFCFVRKVTAENNLPQMILKELDRQNKISMKE